MLALGVRRGVGRGERMQVKILQNEALQIVEGALELIQNRVRQVTVPSGVVLQVKRIQNHKILFRQTK